jgi:hypothetical protein
MPDKADKAGGHAGALSQLKIPFKLHGMAFYSPFIDSERDLLNSLLWRGFETESPSCFRDSVGPVFVLAGL